MSDSANCGSGYAKWGHVTLCEYLTGLAINFAQYKTLERRGYPLLACEQNFKGTLVLKIWIEKSDFLKCSS